NLKYVEQILQSRVEQAAYYDQILAGLNVRKIKIMPGTIFNAAYYPVIFESETQLLKALKLLNDNWIYPRRYFYPALNQLPYLKEKFETPVSEDIAGRVLCLPMYYELREEEMDMIARLLLRAQNN